jgi:hypothetical protein
MKTTNKTLTWEGLTALVGEARHKRDAAKTQEEWDYWEHRADWLAGMAMKRI